MRHVEMSQFFEIVRQALTYADQGGTRPILDYKWALDKVLDVELMIDDLSERGR